MSNLLDYYLQEQDDLISREKEIKNNFLCALRENNIDRVKNLIESYLNIQNKYSNHYMKAIDVGCKPDNKESFLYYMNYWNKYYDQKSGCLKLITPTIEYCIKTKYYEMVHYLVDFYPIGFMSALVALDHVQYDFDDLFSPEYDFNKQLAIECAVDANNMDFIKQYIGEIDINYSSGYLLYKAIESNNIEMTKLLIMCGADVNLRSDEHLSHTFKNKNIGMLQLLIDAGLNLHCAIKINNLDANPIVTLLVNSGVDPIILASVYHNELFKY